MRRSFLVPETLETNRLRLRLPRAEDFPAYADMLANPEVNRFIGGAELADRAEVYRSLGWLIGHWHLRGYGPWLVEDRASGALVGRVGGYYPLEWPAMEIAWTLGRAWWGRGLAQEAARAARVVVRENLKPDRLISVVAVGNEPSQRLALRLGCHEAERTVIWGIDCMVFEHPA